jgi:anti-sigma B factor antagonist
MRPRRFGSDRARARPPTELVDWSLAVSATAFFDVTTIADRAVVRVRARGEIDLASRDILDAQIRALWDSGWEHVVVDLRDVTFMDSSGVHVLIAHHRHAHEHGYCFSIMDGSAPVRRVLQLTAVDQLLNYTVADRP